MHVREKTLLKLVFFVNFADELRTKTPYKKLRTKTANKNKQMLSLTKNIIKEIHSLDQRKARREQHAWLAEGNKSVGDLLEANAFRCLRLVATDEWWKEHPQAKADECYLASHAELERASLLPSPQDVLAVFELPRASTIASQSAKGLVIALDEVQDPGNLGTIIRTADWYGVREIFCSPGTADCFSPKVVQATMSALARVHVNYFEQKEQMTEWLKQYPGNVYGTFLEGENIYKSELKPEGILVMGNEGRGISDEIARCVTKKILIPDFAPDGKHVESLNVSVATAICLSELQRRKI